MRRKLSIGIRLLRVLYSIVGRGRSWAASPLSRGKPLLIYSDSRGLNLSASAVYWHYPRRLSFKFPTEQKLCPHKWTTFADFYEFALKNDLSRYRAVVLHLGVVDFSPRPWRMAREKIYGEKANSYNGIFGEHLMLSHMEKRALPMYEGDYTNNMFTLEMAELYLIPWLRTIPNIIWIGGNPIIKQWRGDYWKDRPENIHLVEDYFRLLDRSLDSVISLSDWSETEVKERTTDNIHLTKSGSDYIYNSILEKIK